MSNRILSLLRLSQIALTDSMVEELSNRGKCRASYDAAAFCALAVAEMNGKVLRDVEWSSVLSYLADQHDLDGLAHSVETLSRIYADAEQGAPLPSNEDVVSAVMCASYIQREVVAWLKTKR